MKKVIVLISALFLISIFTMPQLMAQDSESKVVKLDESSFNKETKSGLILVDFYADWCRPCKMMKPVLEEVAGEYASKITIASVNTDHNKTLSQKFGISGIPCMILFKDGKEVKRIIGYKAKEALVAELGTYIK